MLTQEQRKRTSPDFSARDGRSLSDRVYEYLCEQLERGSIGYGDKLNIKQIAAQLSVSSMPIRDAIKRLEQEQIVAVNPRSHCHVRIPSKQDILDAIDARRMIEHFALGTYYSGVRLSSLARLDEIVGAMRPIAEDDCEGRLPDCLAEYIELDRQFHRELCELSGNEYVMRFYHIVNMHLSMSFSYGIGACHGVAATFAEHQAIISHIKAHSGEALTVLDAHLMRSRKNILSEPTFVSLPD